ncbi:hypothetical protein YSA_03968 [Pseudomonas putida ND6]|uniref:Uncharacterized protein n=1 Tax=Pseudomonas putida ND6 TaxID=231023 RepID=I3UTU3_PSEPU|nr:hypothetical protein YSA_03968 [Pseudomonas putida ND6]
MTGNNAENNAVAPWMVFLIHRGKGCCIKKTGHKRG